jgi:S1-C subfamily serine protease
MAKNLSLKLAAALLLPLLSSAAPPVIDDMELVRSFERGVGSYAGKDGVPSADDLAAATKSPLAPAGDLTPAATKLDRADYETISRSVFMLGSVYKCDKCDHWHAGGIATAWCVGPDGLMVSNAHVFQNTKGAAMGVSDRSGNAYPVTALLAIDTSADVAVFRVKAGDATFQPLPLGQAAAVGDGIRVISHPGRRYFMHTTGEVARYHRQPGRARRAEVTWMSITADYAKGSSGGPVFNAAGEVVGMVASTQSIYYDSDDGSPKGPLQMVVKNCVPVEAIRRLISGK